MPEIKHTFQGGKMNKDLDERLVPNGEYRDAMNVQVRTTDGEAAGTVQNLKGNYTEVENVGTGIHMGGYIDEGQFTSTCVAAIADEKSDKSYWFFASYSPSGAQRYTQWGSQRKSIDTIVEHNSNGQTLIVFSDVWQVIQTVDVAIISENVTSSDTDGELGSLTSDVFTINQSGLGNALFGQITELQITKECYDFVRPGMELRAYHADVNDDGEEVDSNDLLSSNNPIIKDKTIEETIVDDETVYTYKILFHETHDSSDFEGATHFVFKISKTLEFSTRAVSFISTNIIDNLLFWTDGVYEPKVINIDKCKAGSDIDFTHTKLMVDNPASTSSAIVSIDALANNLGSDPIHKWVELKDITVIKKAPTKAPILKMKSELRSNAQDILFNYNFVTSEQTVLATGEIEIIEDNNFTTSNFRKDDILIIEQQDAGIPIIIKAKFISYVNSDGEDVLEITNTIKIKILSVSDNVTIAEAFANWSISLEQRKPLFERKMVRFGYRYKYDDGEYSSFSPWSELAFLPDTFDYNSKDAYNLGMVNNVRQLTIENFIPYKRSAKIKEVDILYKATDSAVVYVAATVSRTKDDEWELFTPDGVDTLDGGDGIIKQGQLSITSEMVHRALPSSQILRGWDNVPIKAKAQEITGNRLVFANYVQGYNITNSINLLQEIISKTPSSFPQKSIKSIRDYKVGMVFGDKYGRETPVINSGYSMELTEGPEATSGDLSIEKTLCAMANRFKLTIDWDNPPSWLTSGGYFKYYIKETSNEYYNLVMDKWYNSGDGTLWLSFNSADRNKVDEETYLLLKNRNGSNEPVLEKARYKIISIKNEAPDFIKTTYYNIGLIKEGVNTTGVSGIWTGDNVENEEPAGFWDSERTMTITGSTWNSGTAGYISGDDTASLSVFGREIKGHVEMQVIGKVGSLVQKSQWRRISHWTRAGSDVQLNWQQPFSSNATGGANMFQAFNCPACTGLTYELAFREALVENKPEFDGKFFVKINKDEVLNQEVIQGSYQFDTVGEIQISYIESDAMNQSAQPMASGIDAEALFNGNSWFYGSFDSVFTNYDGNGNNWDNLNFGNATWNSTNGAGQLNILSGGGGYYSDDGLFNDGDVVAENILGASMGSLPQLSIANLMGNQGNNWYIYDGEGFPEEVNDLDNYNSRGHTLNWDFDPYTYTGFTLNAAADNINSINGFPYPHKWNWNYFGGSSSSNTNNQWSWGMVNKQHPQWWENNIPRQLGDGSEDDPMVSGPSIMGQLCGPLPYTATQGFSDGIDYYENNNVKQYRDATKDFWDNYAQNNGRFFIDGSGSRRQYATLPGQSTIGVPYSAIESEAWDGLPSANDNFASNYPSKMQDGVWSDGLVENGQGYVDFYKGYGLDTGLYPNAISDTNGAQDGTIGRIMLSVPKVSYDANVYTINALQNNAMFIFANAPLDVDGLPIIYRVVHAEKLAIGSMYSKDSTDNFHPGQPPSGGPDGNSIQYPVFGDNGYLYMGEGGAPSEGQKYLGFKCEPDTSDDALKLMTTVEFRKVDRATNSTMDVGLDVSSENGFDPRSHLFHDGRNYISLLIVDYGDEVDVDGNSINNDLGACWETEPKESVDVDLYYEASNAMPMVLNNENAFNHIPVNSKVTVTRELNNEIENISLQGLNHVANNLHFINNKTIVSIVKDSDSGPVLHNQNILIGDTLTFEHNDGTKTSTKVLDYATPISGQSTIYGTLNNQETISGVVDNPRAFTLDETQNINLIWSPDITGDYNNLVLLVENNSFVGSLVGANINSITQSFASDANSQAQSSLTSNSFNTNGWFITNVLNFEDIADVTADDFINPFPGYSAVSISNLGEGGVINGSNIITPFALSFNPDCANTTNLAPGADNYPCFDPSVYDDNPSLDNVGSIPILLAPTLAEGATTGLDVSIGVNSRTGYYVVDSEVWKYPIELSWFNCYTFGNGVESDRVRDDFNAPQIDNGIRVSTTFSGYGEENKSSGIIYSGLYNSTSEVNDLSEFNMSEKITKDLNPSYGSIQRLKTRDTDLVVLAEDKVLKVLANKDAVFNADGNPQLTATNKVLGTAIPFVGDYGISKAPESLASDQYRLYFTDTQRGAVLRLSRDGLTPISNVGMKTWFRENISKIRPNTLLGTFDSVNGEYNLTLKYGSGYENKTISFNEAAKGWVSFKSFIPTKGAYISGKYYTSNSGRIYEHYSDNVDYNTFYGDMVESHIDVVFNEIPSVVKSFRTLNYEGSQARVTQNTADDQYYNLVEKEGWWASNVETDLQSGSDIEFKDKENKWFNYFKGSETSLSNLDTKEFSVQGLGMISIVSGDSVVMGCMDESSFNYNSLANYNVASDCCYVQGCTLEGYLNYDPEACYDDGSCVEFIYGCDDITTVGPYPDVYGNNVEGQPCEYPCQEIISTANEETVVNFGYANYGVDPNANVLSSGFCYQPTGCTNPNASNYNASLISQFTPGILSSQGITNSTILFEDESACTYVYGCMDPIASNYDPIAVFEETPSNCTYVEGCTDSTAFNYNPLATVNNGTCIPFVYGCQNINALNYNPSANVSDIINYPDTACEYALFGCTDPAAINYSTFANSDNGTCMYQEAETLFGVINFPDDSDADILPSQDNLNE